MCGASVVSTAKQLNGKIIILKYYMYNLILVSIKTYKNCSSICN